MVVRLKELSLLAAQFENVGQMRLKTGEIVFCARLHPDFVRGGGCQDELNDFLARDARVPIVMALCNLDFAGEVIIRVQVGYIGCQVFYQAAELIGCAFIKSKPGD